MKLHTSLTALLLAGAFVTSASAQVMTEVRVSTAGTDHEYIEIQGMPGQSTDGLVIAIVEGDDFGEIGFLDRVYDLSGNSFPSGDQFFVFGSDEANLNFPGEIDLVPLSPNNLFENSTGTFYLLSVPDANDRINLASLESTDVRTAVGATTTTLGTLPGVTILDVVGLRDNGATDVIFDGAPDFGPDSTPFGDFVPAGILRNGGCPGDWCSDVFVTFQTDGLPDPPYADPTPGSINPMTTCVGIPSVGTCPGGSNDLGTAYCDTVTNSTGVSGVLGATGSIIASNNDFTLNASSVPPTQFGIFVTSPVMGFIPNPGGSDGNLCVTGTIGRFVGPGQIMPASAAGELSLAVDLTSVPSGGGTVSVMAGETRFFQAWYRDTSGGGSNFTNGLEVAFQ